MLMTLISPDEEFDESDDAMDVDEIRWIEQDR